jgi:hypothetical protein
MVVMNRQITDEILEDLGLEKISVGETSVIELYGADEVARGFVDDVERVFESLAEQAEAVFLDAAQADEIGFRLAQFEDWPELVRVWTPSAEFHPVTADESISVYSTEPDEFFVEAIAQNLPIAFVDSRGEGLILGREGSGLIVGQLVRVPDSIGVPVQVDFDIESWLQAASDDWLCEEVRDKLDHEDAWQRFVSVGMIHRMERPSSAEDARKMVEKLLVGEAVPERNRALEWAKGLDEATADKLAATTLAAVERLQSGLQKLARDFEEQEVVLREDVRRLLHLRDDIASALVLLNQTESLERVEGAVVLVDRFGEELVDKLAEEIQLRDDEQLQRAISCNPEAWWTRLSDQEEL